MKVHVIRMTIELRSSLHIGSGSSDPLLDAPVVRDAFGDYRLPGSALAGAARAFARQRGLDGLFGRGDTEAHASAIEVSDGLLIDWDGEVVLEKRLKGEQPMIGNTLEVQEHVRIEHTSGAADEGGKFDSEVVPQGLRFRVELGFRESLAEAGQTDMAGGFAAIARAFAEGEMLLGGDVTSGLGLVALVPGTASHEVFDFATVAGVEAARRSPSAISAALGRPGLPDGARLPPPKPMGDALEGWLRLRLRVDGPILVGGSQRPKPTTDDGGDASGADLVCGETLVADYSAGRFRSQPWVPGSSLKGVIRHRVWHVAEALGHADPKALIAELFGSVDGPKARSSKITVAGHVLDEAPRTVVQHVAIDRLTGGSLRGALYSEAPIWQDGLEIETQLSFASLSPLEAAVTAQAVLDLATGELPVGGGVNRGNGTLRIAAEAQADRGIAGHAAAFQIEWGNQLLRHDSPTAELEGLLNILDAELARAGGGPPGAGP